MQLNTIKPAAGAKHAKRRVGRGIGSGLGKTAGLGHKGQKARAGGYHKVGFEGGQMPLQRRLPKRGFVSPLKHDTAPVRLSDLNKLAGESIINILALKAAGVIPIHALSAKVIVSGELKRKVVLQGLLVSKGARAAVEAAGGSIKLPTGTEGAAAADGKKAIRKAEAMMRAETRAATTASTIAEEKTVAETKAENKTETKKPRAQVKAEKAAIKTALPTKSAKAKPAAKKVKKVK